VVQGVALIHSSRHNVDKFSGTTMSQRSFKLYVAIAAILFAGAPAWAAEKAIFEFKGAEALLKNDLRAVSLLAALGRNDTAQDILSKAKADYGILLDTLYAQGHYGPTVNIYLDGIEAAEIAALNVPNQISEVRIKIDVGPAFVLSRAKIAPVASFTDMPPGFAVGEVAKSTVILDTATAVVSRWRDIGHAKAKIEDQSLIANHADNTLSADMRVASGPLLRFGPMTITGTQSMKPSRVQAIAGLPVGAQFSPKELDRVATRLRRTGAFRSVSLVEADQISPPDILGITANLVEEKVRRYQLSGEIASQDGLSLSGQWAHRNLLGGAERLTLSGAISKLGVDTGGQDYEISANFDRPATFTPDTTLNLGITFSRQKENQQRETALNTSAGLTHYFSNTLTGTATAAYHISRVIDPSGTTEFSTLSLPLGAAWDTRAVKKDATDGVAITAEVKPFYGLGFTDNGVRMIWDARGYKSANKSESVVFAARVQVGSIFGSSLAGTPRDDLFFSGGPATVRGQPYRSLGVFELADNNGDAFKTGGTHFLAGSIESRVKIGRDWGLVGFLDVGHIDANAQFSLNDNWHSGAGIGLRYLTTIGPIRFDVAAPVAGTTGNGLQLYVGLGQSF
jgi:translocation and assembly module TamA